MVSLTDVATDSTEYDVWWLKVNSIFHPKPRVHNAATTASNDDLPPVGFATNNGQMGPDEAVHILE